MSQEQMIAAQVPWSVVGAMAAFILGCVIGWFARAMAAPPSAGETE